ncbi:MAG: hypothetical protein GX460_05785 [Firmicutes bacterium]|nr:hypothetical protein [Bacillota bacterium]
MTDRSVIMITLLAPSVNREIRTGNRRTSRRGAGHRQLLREFYRESARISARRSPSAMGLAASF